ncbi:methyl-accepting chemotaxis protein [Aliarcobacter butzleri]|uniref:Methyl-accepting chemotaxis protein n=1 Tax=Aliarcobacter butzleri TaxID=28197 RepID=A0AAP4UZM1_9BACT|nr:methyl-accepting chemotaxis protein [Aliarcobacter butzleri]MDN5053225.1 methyl-accepting chemotaxis protein [Aliarcobacter butzleri]MDN5074163.1 methyl-accepting chemotaxis protein [Aliarcobacter butzleri]MDN5117661.1 methyl-accepting chemotaxis protein [Aliarcobacter butzleri]MDN5133459.1 methyl-accepting chemotaxis protein [Aliarcobacter butzleri]
MNLIQNLSFRLKLLLIAIPPLLGIIFYSIIFIFNLMGEKTNLEANKRQMQEIAVLSKIVHFMQIERGLSAGFVSSNGSKNSDKLLETRQKVSKALEEIKSIPSELKSSEKIISYTAELSQKRNQVDSLQITASETEAYFTKTIGSIINITTIVPNIIDDKDSRNIVQADTHLVSMKEQLAQLRANLNVAFIKNNFVENDYFNFAVSFGAFNINKNKFLVIAPENVTTSFKNSFKGEAVDKTFSMIEVAKAKAMEGNFGIDSSIWFSNASATIDILRNIEEELYDIAYKQIDSKISDMNNEIYMILFIIIILLILEIVLLYVISKNILLSLGNFKEGLLSFFSFLNKETSKTSRINIDSKDEFGEMANIVNTNIERTQKLIQQDNQLIDEVKNVVLKVKDGYLDNKISNKTDNQSLEELKNNFNEMLEVIASKVCKDINKLTNVLDSYAKLDFRAKVQNDKGIVSVGVNNLGNIITSMLVENKSNGLTLDESSNILLANVYKLNVSSNEAAASLEETAAALEEITSNIRNTTGNIAEMSNLSDNVTKSSTNGEKLANKTTIAMDEINTQVNLINESISVIDQIAFQTNILSLNAAVEAATAGEAGKGFAVVAQEVRNLASRSAEAAKEIKNIVENAKNKADEGKSIASHMIDGYKELNENIQQTINLISDIEMSSKEQLTGIEQINDALNQLDQQTQQNAQIASQTHDVALVTDNIAKLVVGNANDKEFEGKNEVKAKSLNIKKDSSYNVKTNEVVYQKAPQKTTTTKVSAKTITPSNNNDEWESF